MYMRTFKFLKITFFFSFLFLCVHSFAQTKTIKGQVVDAENKDGIFRATVSYSIDGFAQGVTSDDNGRFEIEIPQQIDTIKISHISYKPKLLSIRSVKKSIKIPLEPHASQIKEVVITAKREKYTNKNNPAVDLIEKVVENRDKNSILNHCPLQYTSHNKSLIALDPTNDTLLNKIRLRPVVNLMQSLDQTYYGSKNYLPLYFFEEITKIFCKDGGKLDEQRIAVKHVNLTDQVTEDDAKQMRSSIFQKINLYQTYVDVLGHQIMSPINRLAPTFYKFFIEDTLMVNDKECIQLSFIPRNLYDIGFMGYLYITNDSKYQLISAKLSIPEKSNINFIDKIDFIQTYRTDSLEIDGKKQEVTYIVEDAIYAKMNFYSLKTYGYSINTYSQPIFEPYELMKEKDLKDFEITQENRLSPLTETEIKTYQLPDSLNSVTWFRVTKYLSEIFYGGYLLMGPLEIGPIDNLFSFNKVEGERYRFSGKTNYKLSRNWYVNWMLAYGTVDKKFKYEVDLKYSFNSLTKNPNGFPAHFIGVKYTNNTFIPGRTIFNSNYDRITLSITDIVDYKLAFQKALTLQWMYETRKGISFNPYLTLQEVSAYGNWNFANLYGKEITGFRYDRLGINLNIVFNGKWIQRNQARVQLAGNYTSMNINYELGFENTHLLKVKAYRKLNLNPFGYMMFWAEGGYIWGKMLSPYLFTNTTYNSVIYHQSAFNLMSTMEFFSDKYVQLFAIYNLNGILFNRIPLIRELGLREEINFKATYGGLRDGNRFMIDKEYVKTFTDKPYIEVGAGFQNLFNLIGVEYIRRITYAEGLPEYKKWGIRLNLVMRF